MPHFLLIDEPYRDVTDGPEPSFEPCIPLTLYLPSSRRRVAVRRALIDTGSPVTLVYARDIEIHRADADFDKAMCRFHLNVQVADRVYPIDCYYVEKHPFARGEEMLLGLDILENWLVTLDGTRRRLSVAHVDPGER